MIDTAFCFLVLPTDSMHDHTLF